jgi:anti-sigma factor RsiW
VKECARNQTIVLRFLSGNLSPRERAAFLAHVPSCADCQATLEQEQALSNMLERSRPLYTASPALREQITALVEQRRGSNSFRRRLLALLAQVAAHWRLLPVPAAAIIVVVLLFANIDREARAASYVETAASAHRAYALEGRTVEFRTESLDELKAWVARRAHFQVQMPVLPLQPGTPAVYRLVGASLLPYRKHQAVVAVYEGKDERVSLIVAPSSAAAVAGGDVIRAQNLVFHFFIVNSLRVVTWTSHGTAYALVSSLSVASDRACLACHQRMTDSSLFGAGDKRRWLEHPRRVGN